MSSSAPITNNLWPKKVSVYEVGPRDGLQSETKILSVEERIRFIKLLIATGLQDIEVGSFVRADRIPQLADTEAIVKALQNLKSDEKKQAKFWAFVPNDKGLSMALESGIDGVGFFFATSDTFCRKNVNRGQGDLFPELSALIKRARKEKLAARVYLSTLTYCPYEGLVEPKKVQEWVSKILEAGAKEVVLSDTTGHANPRSIRKVLEMLLKNENPKHFSLHLHDTRGLALANILEGLHMGISRFDSSVGGIGGCPYAPGASGNLATEDLVNMLAGMGLLQEVELGLLAKASLFAEEKLGHELPSRVLKTLRSEGQQK